MTTTTQRPRRAETRGATRPSGPIAADGWPQASPATVAALLRWVDATGDALAGVDARGRVAFANAAFERTFAVGTCGARGDAARAPLSRFVPLLDAPRLASWADPTRAAGPPRVHRLLAEAIAADGERFLAAVTLLPVPPHGPPADAAAAACVVALRPLDGPRVPPAPPEAPRTAAVAQVELAVLVDAALRALGDADARRRCRLALHDPHARIAADPEPLREALVHVLDNACRHAFPGTPIALRSRAEAAEPCEGEIEGEGEASADRIVLTVADRGPGLARAHVQRAFEPFWRGPVAGRSPGHGLGLAIARELVDGQRGWVELRSAAGVGTEVDLWLPAARPGSEAGP